LPKLIGVSVKKKIVKTLRELVLRHSHSLSVAKAALGITKAKPKALGADALFSGAHLKHFLTSFLCLVSLLWLMPAHASSARIYDGSPIQLGSGADVLRDSSGDITFGDILLELELNGHSSLPWVTNASDIPNFGYSTDTVWLKQDVKNATSRSEELLAVISYALLDEVEVYVYADSSLRHSFQTGDTFPFASRAVTHRDFLFPLTLEPGETVSLFVKVRSQGSLQIPISIWDRDDYFIADQQELSLKNLYYGMMIVMVLYNLFIYLSVRERAYLYYVGFVTSFVAMQAAMHGILFQFFIPQYPQLHQLSVLFLVPCTMLFSCLFALSFLNLKQVAPWMDNAIRWVAVGAFLCVLGAFVLPYRWSTEASVLLVVFASILMIASGPIAWLKGQSSARYYTIAWFILLIGTTSTALSKFGMLPSNAFTEYGLIFGSALEAVLLSFALADRLNGEKEARFRAQQNQLVEARQRMEAEEQLRFQSTHDSLTGLPNKTLLFEAIEALIDSDRVHRFALVKVSMGRFDEISKTLGQYASELVLKAFAERMALALGAVGAALPVTERNVVAHYDHLAFSFLIDTGKVTDLYAVLNQIKNGLSEPLEFREMRIDTGVIMGVSIYPDHSNEAVELVKQAQIAMGFSQDGGDIYDPALNPYSERRLSLMGELQNAIDQNHLSLHFQPQLDIRSGEVVGAEALIRWNHPAYGYIPPMEFIPHAEEAGLIKPLTYWVIDHSLFACRQWIDSGTDLDISINISAANLHETNIVKNIQVLLNKHRVPPERLKIEITETAMMINPENALRVLTELSRIGVKIAVDDFGTGHSSLSYIKRLPADEIKIDRSFVIDMGENADDEVIVSTTINMCHNLGYRVVAEGIEDQLTLTKLEALNCDVAQGYYHCRPLAFEDFNDWLNQSRGSAA